MKSLFRSKIFWFGLALRLGLSFTGGSKYFEEMFVPFVQKAIENIGTNPWALMPPQNFPYGITLLAPLALSREIFSLIVPDISQIVWLSYFSLKAPLLIFDILFLLILIRFSPQRQNQIKYLYWLNPILIFITYGHGQLDLVPMFLITFAILALARHKLLLSALVLALAVNAKFHTIIVLPLMAAFIWNTQFSEKALKEIAKFLLVFALTSAVLYLPFLSNGQTCYNTICAPELFRIFGFQIKLGDKNVLFLGIGALLFVLSRLVLSARITAEGLIYGSGILFGTLLAVVDAMPGWYLWFMPFVVLFYANYSLAPVTILMAHLVSYFLFFLLPLDFLDESLKNVIHGILFTGLQITVIGFIYLIWTFVINTKSPWKGRTRPLLLGIAGDSGSGKNTLTEALKNLFGMNATVLVEGDDYHKWERGHTKWLDYTHLHPRANYLENMALHTIKLLSGSHIFQPHYDHGTGQFTAPRILNSNRTIITQGLHTFYMKSLREKMDLKIFIQPEENIRTAWKLKRDVLERGHSVEKVITSLDKRKSDSLAHIQPQKDCADLVVEYLPLEPFDPLKVLDGYEPRFYVSYTIWNDTPLESLLTAYFNVTGNAPEIFIPEGNMERVNLSFKNLPSATQLNDVSLLAFESLRQLTRSRTAPKFQSGVEGLNQLMILALLNRKIQNEEAGTPA